MEPREFPFSRDIITGGITQFSSNACDLIKKSALLGAQVTAYNLTDILRRIAWKEGSMVNPQVSEPRRGKARPGGTALDTEPCLCCSPDSSSLASFHAPSLPPGPGGISLEV